jgi:hypothetical protein
LNGVLAKFSEIGFVLIAVVKFTQGGRRGMKDEKWLPLLSIFLRYLLVINMSLLLAITSRLR